MRVTGLSHFSGKRRREGHHLTGRPRDFTIVGIDVRKHAIAILLYAILENLCELARVASNSKILEISLGYRKTW